jgi:hypothetical protein
MTIPVRPVCRWATSGPIAPTAYTRLRLGDIPQAGLRQSSVHRFGMRDIPGTNG